MLTVPEVVLYIVAAGIVIITILLGVVLFLFIRLLRIALDVAERTQAAQKRVEGAFSEFFRMVRLAGTLWGRK